MNQRGLKIYVGCLPGNATESKVEDIFSKFGVIKNVTLSRKNDQNHQNNNKCVGSGKIECEERATFEKILKANEILYEGRKLEVSEFLEREDLEKLHKDVNKRKILVKYLDEDVQDKDLIHIFSMFGRVANAFVSSDKKQNLKLEYPNNYGMVIMQDALATYKALNGKVLVRGKPVIIRLHRFRNLSDAIYEVQGKKYTSDDLLNVQIGKEPKHDIRHLMSQEYASMADEWERKFKEYRKLLLYDRKKLKKECKRKKDKELKKILVEMDKVEREDPEAYTRGRNLGKKKKDGERQRDRGGRKQEQERKKQRGEVQKREKRERKGAPKEEIITRNVPFYQRDSPSYNHRGSTRGSAMNSYDKNYPYRAGMNPPVRPNPSISQQTGPQYYGSRGNPYTPVKYSPFNSTPNHLKHDPSQRKYTGFQNYQNSPGLQMRNSPYQRPQRAPSYASNLNNNTYQSFASTSYNNDDDIFDWSQHSQSVFDHNSPAVHQQKLNLFKESQKKYSQRKEKSGKKYVSNPKLSTPIASHNHKNLTQNGQNSSLSPTRRGFLAYKSQSGIRTERKFNKSQSKQRYKSQYITNRKSNLKPLGEIKEVEEEIKINSNKDLTQSNDSQMGNFNFISIQGDLNQGRNLFGNGLANNFGAKGPENFRQINSLPIGEPVVVQKPHPMAVKLDEEISASCPSNTSESENENLDGNDKLIFTNKSQKLYVNFDSTAKKIPGSNKLQKVSQGKKGENDSSKQNVAKKVAIDLFDKFQEQNSVKKGEKNKGVTLEIYDNGAFNSSKVSSDRKYRSMNDAGEIKSEEAGVKQGTMQRIISPLHSMEQLDIEMDDDEVIEYDEDYYTILTMVYKEDDKLVRKIKRERAHQNKVYFRGGLGFAVKFGEEKEESWVQKMIRNSRFKIYFNHYESNMRINRPEKEEEEVDLETLMTRCLKIMVKNAQVEKGK